MSKGNSHNDLDNFLKESFKEHTITPAPELWDKIEGKFQPKVVPIHQYARLKMALYASAIVIVGLVAVILLSKKEIPDVMQKTEALATEEYSAPPVKVKISEPESVRTEKPGTDYVKGGEPILGQPEQNTSNINLAANKKVLETEQLTEIEQDKIQNETNTTQFSPKQSESNTSGFTEANNENESTVLSPNVEEDNKTIVSKNNNSGKKKEDSVTKRSNSSKKSNRTGKRRASKNNLPKRKNYTNYSQKGKILEDFTIKLNFTPTVTHLVITKENEQMPDYQYLEIDDPGFTFNGGIELEYSINEKWSVYTGVKTYYFKQSFEESNYPFESPFQNNQPLISRAGKYLIQSNNPENIPNSTEVDAYLKLRYLDIPLAIRYHLNNFYFDAGVNYSYLIDNYSNIVPKNSSSTLYFEQNGGLKKHTFGFVGGFGYRKTFNSGLRFEAGPEVKFATNNLYTGEAVSGIPLFVGFRIAFCIGRYYSE